MKKLIPKVSVIIPTYNRAHSVGRAIQSVLDQTFQDFEIIVVDDASSDNTEDVVKKFLQDSRIHYRRLQQNRGAPWARNSGAEVAKGKYFAFLDSDDKWFPDFLERHITTLENLPSNIGMSCCNMLRISGERREIVGPGKRSLSFTENLIHADGLCCSSFVVKKDAFHTINGFDVRLSSFQDFDFLLKISEKFQIKVIEDVLLEYHLNEDSISLNMNSKAKGFETIIDLYREEILRNGIMHRYLFRVGQYYILAGHLAKGWQTWRHALRYNLMDAKIWKHFLISLGGVRLYKRVMSLHNERMEHKKTQGILEVEKQR